MDVGLFKRTCLRQLKFRGLQCFLCGAIFTILLFFIMQFVRLGKWGLLLSIMAGFTPVFLVQCIQIIRFFRMIRRQEREFGICFSDEDAKLLWKNAPVFVTEDWCILGGTAAFYRGYLKNVTWQYEHRYRGPGSYYLIVKTLDGRRYRLWLDSKSTCAKIRRWWKNGMGEELNGL